MIQSEELLRLAAKYFPESSDQTERAWELAKEVAGVAAVRGAEAPAAITESEKRRQTSDWIVVVGKGSWAKCYGPFAKYDDAIAWCKANQYIEADSYETYPVNPPGLTPPSDQEK